VGDHSDYLSTVIVPCCGIQEEHDYQPCFQHTRSMFSSVSGVVMLILCHNLGVNRVICRPLQRLFSLAMQWLCVQKESGEENFLLKIGCT